MARFRFDEHGCKARRGSLGNLLIIVAGADMIECEGSSACPGNKWFHIKCVNLTAREVTKMKSFFCACCTQLLEIAERCKAASTKLRGSDDEELIDTDKKELESLDILQTYLDVDYLFNFDIFPDETLNTDLE